MIKVRFEKVGRDRQTWEQELREVSYSSLYRAVKDRKALASKEIDFEWDEDSTTTGAITAGGRDVGRFTVI